MAPRLRDVALSPAYRRRLHEAAVALLSRAGRVGGRFRQSMGSLALDRYLE